MLNIQKLGGTTAAKKNSPPAAAPLGKGLTDENHLEKGLRYSPPMTAASLEKGLTDENPLKKGLRYSPPSMAAPLEKGLKDEAPFDKRGNVAEGNAGDLPALLMAAVNAAARLRPNMRRNPQEHAIVEQAAKIPYSEMELENVRHNLMYADWSAKKTLEIGLELADLHPDRITLPKAEVKRIYEKGRADGIIVEQNRRIAEQRRTADEKRAEPDKETRQLQDLMGKFLAAMATCSEMEKQMRTLKIDLAYKESELRLYRRTYGAFGENHDYDAPETETDNEFFNDDFLTPEELAQTPEEFATGMKGALREIYEEIQEKK